MPDINNLKEELFILAPEMSVHHGRKGMAEQ
jgi:hypothetical protein